MSDTAHTFRRPFQVEYCGHIGNFSSTGDISSAECSCGWRIARTDARAVHLLWQEHVQPQLTALGRPFTAQAGQ